MWDPPGSGIETVSPELAGRPHLWAPREAQFLFFFFLGRQGREEGKGGVSEQHLQWYACENSPWFCSSLHDIAVAREKCVTEARISPFLTICLSELFTVLRRTIQTSVTDITRTKDFIIETFQRVTGMCQPSWGHRYNLLLSVSSFLTRQAAERPCQWETIVIENKGMTCPYRMNWHTVTLRDAKCQKHSWDSDE